LISVELQAQILRLHHAEGWPPGTIAYQLGIHHSAVERVLNQAGVPRATQTRPSMVDPYMPFVLETLKKYPRLTASRLYHMVKVRGYPGREGHFRSIITRVRPCRPPEAYLRLRTLPGEQGQVDWGHFGKVIVGTAKRMLLAFVMVLSWSRAIFLRFFLGQHLSNFLRGHAAAFNAFHAVPRVLLYDNLKSAVLERVGDAIHFNPTLLEFSGHYRYEPRPVAVARGNQKGRVERAIRFVRTSFYAAREWKDIEDLNRQAELWCQSEAMDRPWPEDPKLTVREAFAKEKDTLLPIAPNPFPTEERVERSAGKTPYVRFDLNDYSVPHEFAGRTLVVLSDLKEVKILHGNDVVAVHPRSFDKGAQIEDPRHIKELEGWKRAARKHRGVDRLSHCAPRSGDLLKLMAERGGNLGNAVSMLLKLLDTYGAEELNWGIKEALEKGVPHPHAVRHALEHKRQAEGKPAALPIDLPDDPRIRGLSVKPHSLQSYDQLKKDEIHDKDNANANEATKDHSL